MIKIEKGPIPPVLEGLLATWTAQLLAAIQTANEEEQNRIGRRYSDQRIKRALLAETNGKCAYCESRVPATSYPRVEHIKPRSIAPELTFSWPNLTIACEVCHRNKSDYWNLSSPLINPVVEDPIVHLTTVEKAAWLLGAKLDSSLGAFAIQKFELNRAGLWERRQDRLRVVQGVIERWRNAATPDEGDGFWRSIQREMADDKELLLMVRSVVMTATVSSPR